MRVLAGTSLVVIMTASTLNAKTVAWWPMNGTDGAKAGAIASRGDTEGTLTAYPVSTSNGSEISGDGEYPVFQGNDFAPTVSFMDPVTGETFAEQGSLRFKKKGLNANASMLRVSNPAALRLKTFTFETFVRRSTWADWQVIAVMPGRLTTDDGAKIPNWDSWGFRFTNKNLVHVRFTNPGATPSANVGSFNTTITTAETDHPWFNAADGCWHHVAFSVDDATHAVKIYLDYRLVKQGTLNFSVGYFDNADLYLGATLQTAGPFDGYLAQTRISDTVLEPGQFLTMTRAESAVGEDPATLMHLDFDRAERMPAWLFPSRVANIPAAYIVRNSFKLAAKTDDKPGVTVANGIRGEARANSGTIANTYASTVERGDAEADKAQRRYVTQPVPATADFTKSSFTVECFYKYTRADGILPQYEPLIRRRGGDNVQFNLGFSGGDGNLAASIQVGNNETLAMTDPDRTADGKWHHGALVVDRENGRLVLFRDYQVHGWMAIPAGKDVVASAFPIYLLGADNGRSCNATIDNARVTMRALVPDEFVTLNGGFTPSETLAWVSFEGEGSAFAKATNSPFALDEPILAASATGGAEPVSSSEVKRPKIFDNAGNLLRKTNVASAYFDNSWLKYVANPTLTREEAMTVEYLVKADGVQPEYSPIIRCGRDMIQTLSPAWSMAFGQKDATGKSNGKLRVRCVMRKVNGELDNDSVNMDTPFVIGDGKWHHVAFAFEKLADFQTKVSVWVDYCKDPWTRTADAAMDWGDSMGAIYVGRGANATPAFKGWIDEIRVSRGVLDSSKFLRARSGDGLVIHFK